MPAPKGTAELLIEIALKEVGYIEEAVPENKTKYQKANQPWCGAFVNWCGKKSEVKIPNTVYTPAGANAFKKMKRWHDVQEAVPLPGDIVYFDFPADGIDRISHVGIVIKVREDGRVVTVEGNTTHERKGDQRNGGEVCRKVRAYKKKNGKKLQPSLPVFIVGFGRPEFEALHKTADQARANA
jgi:hypothetical protein